MTMECSLLYVSRVTMDAAQRDSQVASMVAHARAYNPTVGITGGLVRAKGWFAQLLEGSTEAVGTLMQRIERDPRHCDVTLLRVSAREDRRLGKWSMAYDGEWRYSAQIIADLFAPGAGQDPERIDRLERMIVAFALG